MRLRVFFTVLISDLITIMLSMLYAALFAWLIERVIPLDGMYYWCVLGAFFVFLSFINFYYSAPSYVDVSLGRDVNPGRDAAWVAYFGAFSGSLFLTAVIVIQIDQIFPLQGRLSYVVSGIVFTLVLVCLLVCVMKLRRKQ